MTSDALLALESRLDAPGRRADHELATAAHAALAWTAILPRDRVRATVEGGVITLLGDVDWAYQRTAALMAVNELHGLASVWDLITVKPRITVGGIQSDIVAALAQRARGDAQAIGVLVQGAAVTLSGALSHPGDRELALRAAWSTPGVSFVVDHMDLLESSPHCVGTAL